MKTTLSTKKDIWIVKFQYQSEAFIFSNYDIGALGDIVKENAVNGRGISELLRFDTAKNKFCKVSKELIANIFGFDTHSILELKKCGYIKA